MDSRTEARVDAALDRLADEVRSTSPEPSPDLVARVLADAAQIGQTQAPAPTAVRAHAAPATGPWLLDILFGWTGGAVATMALGLAVGVGFGMEMDQAEMPLFAEEGEAIVALIDPAIGSDEIL